MELTGTKTVWDSVSGPPSTSLSGLTSNVTDSELNDLKDLTYFEFIRIASTALFKHPYNSFPMSNAFNSLTGSIANRTGHNTRGYVIPRAGKLLGFCIDFVEAGKDATFYVFCWDPDNTSLKYVSSISSSNNDYEPYGAATTALNEEVAVTEGSYLFCVQLIQGVANPATGPCHITVYVTFT